MTALDHWQRLQAELIAEHFSLPVDEDRYSAWSTTEGRLLVWPPHTQPPEFCALLAWPEAASGHC